MKHVLFVTDNEYFKRNGLFDRDNPINSDGWLEGAIRLREALARDGYQADTSDIGDITTADAVVFLELYAIKPFFGRFLWSAFGKPRGNRQLTDLFRAMPRTARRILVLHESPAVAPQSFSRPIHRYFDTVLTWDDTLIDERKYFKFYVAQPDWRLESPVPFRDRACCALIASNRRSDAANELYSARVEVVEYFEHACPELFDLYGGGWERYQTFRGRAMDKVRTLSRYKFNICYENNRDLKGYVTEKIFDSLRALCVPVYWGADNILDYVPAGAFIDRRAFASTAELVTYLRQMPETEYMRYLEAIDSYLRSPSYQRFSIANSVQILQRAICSRS